MDNNYSERYEWRGVEQDVKAHGEASHHSK